MFPQEEEERNEGDQWTQEQLIGIHWKAGGQRKKEQQLKAGEGLPSPILGKGKRPKVTTSGATFEQWEWNQN